MFKPDLAQFEPAADKYHSGAPERIEKRLVLQGILRGARFMDADDLHPGNREAQFAGDAHPKQHDLEKRATQRPRARSRTARRPPAERVRMRGGKRWGIVDEPGIRNAPPQLHRERDDIAEEVELVSQLTGPSDDKEERSLRRLPAHAANLRFQTS